jgi:two-component system nitrogen regulation response regulator GlnG
LSTVWIVDDDASIRWVLAKALTGAGYDVESYDNAETTLSMLQEKKPDVVMTDIRMPGMSGLELAEQIQLRAEGVPTIIMTAHTDLESALSSYQSGAFEYLPKPFDIDEVLNLVSRALDQTGAANVPANAELPAQDDIIGEAPAMQEVFRAIGRLAKSHINVLIWGESGTGKELVARALHRHSPRSDEPFIPINTAAIPADLLESELFGHEKGAFTGAHERRAGRFEQADGGTLFLDEIGDMSLELQTRLLRILSDKRFYRVGGRQQIEVNVRVLAATNQDLQRRVEEGRFREDLYHRLNVIRIELPALRERREDIPLLARLFLKQCADELEVGCKHLTKDAMELLVAHQWKGNVRELENVCRWITVMAPGSNVSVEQMPKELSEAGPEIAEDDWIPALRRVAKRKLNLGQEEILAELGPSFEAVLLQTALDHTKGHRQKAARCLGWGRNTLTRKLRELGLDEN